MAKISYFFVESTKIRLHDLGGGDLNEFVGDLIRGSRYNESDLAIMYIVCPLAMPEMRLLDKYTLFYNKLELLDIFWPHFSGEEFRNDLSLRLYKYKNTS